MQITTRPVWTTIQPVWLRRQGQRVSTATISWSMKTHMTRVNGHCLKNAIEASPSRATVPYIENRPITVSVTIAAGNETKYLFANSFMDASLCLGSTRKLSVPPVQPSVGSTVRTIPHLPRVTK